MPHRNIQQKQEWRAYVPEGISPRNYTKSLLRTRNAGAGCVARGDSIEPKCIFDGYL